MEYSIFKWLNLSDTLDNVILILCFITIILLVKIQVKNNLQIEKFDNAKSSQIEKIVEENKLVSFQTTIGTTSFYIATVQQSNISLPKDLPKNMPLDCEDVALILVPSDEIDSLYKTYMRDISAEVAMCTHGENEMCNKNDPKLKCDKSYLHCQIVPQYHHQFNIYKLEDSSNLSDSQPNNTLIIDPLPVIPGSDQPISHSDTPTVYYNIKGVSDPPHFDLSTGFLSKYQPILSKNSTISADLYTNAKRELCCGNSNAPITDKKIFFTEKIVNNVTYITIGIMTKQKDVDTPLWLSTCPLNNLFPTTMFSEPNAMGIKPVKYYPRVCLTANPLDRTILYFNPKN